jgi:hypothetical protein
MPHHPDKSAQSKQIIPLLKILTFFASLDVKTRKQARKYIIAMHDNRAAQYQMRLQNASDLTNTMLM